MSGKAATTSSRVFELSHTTSLWARTGADRSDQDSIRLPIVADHEHVCSDVDEPVLAIEGLGSFIALPHPQPKRGCLRELRLVLDSLHQVLGNALPMPLASDVESPKLDRVIRHDTRGGRPATKLREANQLLAVYDYQRVNAWIRDLVALLNDAVGSSQVQRHVFVSVIRRERFSKSARRQLGQAGRVGRDGPSNHSPPLPYLVFHVRQITQLGRPATDREE